MVKSNGLISVLSSLISAWPRSNLALLAPLTFIEQSADPGSRSQDWENGLILPWNVQHGCVGQSAGWGLRWCPTSWRPPRLCSEAGGPSWSTDALRSSHACQGQGEGAACLPARSCSLLGPCQLGGFKVKLSPLPCQKQAWKLEGHSSAGPRPRGMKLRNKSSPREKPRDATHSKRP